MTGRAAAGAQLPMFLRRARAAIRLSLAAAPGTTCAVLALAVVEGTLPVVGAWSLKLLLDELVHGQAADPGRVAAATAVLAGSGLLLGIRQSLDTYAQAAARRALRLAVQDRLFGRVNEYVGLARFEDPRFLNRLRLAEQAGGEAPEQLVDGAVALVRNALLVGGFATALLVVWPPVVALLAAVAVPTVALHVSLSRRRAALAEGLTPLMRRQVFFSTLLTDARAAKEVRLFDLGCYLQDRMMGQLRSAQAAEAALDRRAVRAETALEVLGALVTAAAAVVAAVQAVRGRLSIGDVSLFLVAVGGVHSAVGSASGGLASAYQGLLLFGHYLDVVDEQLPAPGTPAVAAAPLRRDVELRDVWFRYGPDQPWVLRGVDLRIPYGATVGLVGVNGAGKSTIVKLLCRMYEPDAGAIRWDGVDLSDLDPRTLRAHIGAVFQDYMSYDLTAAENIGIGRLPALDDPAAIAMAARAAGVHDKISSLPAGYRTLLSRLFEPEDGDEPSSLLSGGQWQRVALARAFLRGDADLMILDEPSAGLDAEAEHELHERTRRLRAGRTSLLISHRLGALRDADLIYVLDGGRVVERGRHAELARGGGPYARLFALQAAGYRDAAPLDAAAGG